ncbi:MAG: hypothetical protein Q8M15_11600 [Bacteroidota bacterium]|nr:hypothetical protein [Bacteroidota bacterium]
MNVSTDSISFNISLLFKSKHPGYLFKAVYLIIKRNRIGELLFGFYNFVFHKPSTVKFHSKRLISKMLEEHKNFISAEDYLSRKTLILIYGKNYAVNLLPDDFAGARPESVLQSKGALVIGEYGVSNKRIFYVNQSSCKVSDFYSNNKAVRHIHAVNNNINEGELLITTGDAGKYLDLWCTHEKNVVFKKRLRKKLAGYTAITILNNICYMGSDFTSRPNYIVTLNNKKFFFPKKAYKMYVVKFKTYQNRYILSVNAELPYFGYKQTVSVFDSLSNSFVFCEYVE